MLWGTPYETYRPGVLAQARDVGWVLNPRVFMALRSRVG